MSDEDLVNIAATEPSSPDSLAELLDAKQRYLRQASEEMFEELKLAENDPVEPSFAGNDPEEVKLIKTCMAMVRSAAEKSGISQSLLGTRKDVIKVIRGEESQILRSWRLELVGRQLEESLRKAG